MMRKNQSDVENRGDAFFESITERAEQLYAMGRCDQAVAVLTEELDTNVGQPEIVGCLAELLIDSGEYSSALKFLEAAGGGELENELLFLIGICLEALGDRASAGTVADRLLSIEGQRCHGLVIKARFAVRSGDPNLARKLFEEAIASDTGCGRAWFGLGTILREGDGVAESLTCFENAFKASPNSREILLALHEATVSTGSHRRLESALKQALSRQPLNRRARFLLIDSLLRQGEVDEAMSEIESALADFGIDDGLLAAALSVRQQLEGQPINETSEATTTVSLCMIVKNEEKHLARCLKSVKPVVHEIVVVDTGSTDRTREISRAFGARVLDFDWVDDFSKARNFSLAQAFGDWIFILDADEVLSPRSHAAFRSLVRNPQLGPTAYSFRTRNYTHHSSTFGWTANRREFYEEEGSGWFPSDKVRLFPKHARIRFANPVHELVEPCLLEMGIDIKSCPDIPIHHFGNLQDANTTNKTKAYLDLGRKKLKKNRRNLSTLKEMAIQSAKVGNHQEALSLWKRFLELQPYSPEALMNSASACWNLGRYPEAAQWADKAIRRHPMFKEGLFNKAVAVLMMGRAGEARTILEIVLEREPTYPPAQFMFCVASACAGEPDTSEQVLQALNATPLGPFLGESFLDVAKRMFSASQVEYARLTVEAAMAHGYASEELHALLDDCLATV
jgi:tetratricopeptide (TPR) repeat protein